MLLFLVSGGILLNSARQQLIDLWTSRYQTNVIQTRIQAESANLETLMHLRQSVAAPATDTCKTFNQTARVCSKLSSFSNSIINGSKISSEATDNSGSKAVISRSVAYLSWLNSQQIAAPLIFPGSLSVDTELHIGANPDGGGKQIPLAIWSTGKIQAASNSSLLSLSNDQVLNLSLRLDSGIADQAIMQTQGGDFPDDIFNYVFGIADNQYPVIQESANLLSPDQCKTLNENSSGLYWVEGAGICELNTLGQASANNPRAVILVLHAVPLHVNDNAKIHGLIVDFVAEPSEDRLQTLYFDRNSLLYGSLLSNRDLNHRLSGYVSIIWQDFSSYFNKPTTRERGAMLILNGSWIDAL